MQDSLARDQVLHAGFLDELRKRRAPFIEPNEDRAQTGDGLWMLAEKLEHEWDILARFNCPDNDQVGLDGKTFVEGPQSVGYIDGRIHAKRNNDRLVCRKIQIGYDIVASCPGYADGKIV